MEDENQTVLDELNRERVKRLRGGWLQRWEDRQYERAAQRRAASYQEQQERRKARRDFWFVSKLDRDTEKLHRLVVSMTDRQMALYLSEKKGSGVATCLQIIPGLGDFYLGQFLMGIGAFVLTGLLYFTVVGGIVMHLMVFAATPYTTLQHNLKFAESIIAA